MPTVGHSEIVDGKYKNVEILEGTKNMAEHGKEKECYKWQSRVKEQQMMSMHSMVFTWWNIVLE